MWNPQLVIDADANASSSLAVLLQFKWCPFFVCVCICAYVGGRGVGGVV